MINKFNKKAKGPTLTWIFIGIAVSVLVLTLSFSSLGTFLADNNTTISEVSETGDNFTEVYNDIDSLGGTTGGLSDRSLLKDVWSAATGTVNVFVMGLAAISEFFRMISIIDNLFGIIEGAVPGFNALFGLLTLVITVYISMAILKAKRGTSEVA